jgi:hypothetical protein
MKAEMDRLAIPTSEFEIAVPGLNRSPFTSNVLSPSMMLKDMKASP